MVILLLLLIQTIILLYLKLIAAAILLRLLVLEKVHDVVNDAVLIVAIAKDLAYLCRFV